MPRRFKALSTDRQFATQDGTWRAEVMVERVKGQSEPRTVIAPGRLLHPQVLAVEEVGPGRYCLTGSWVLAADAEAA